ncbi:hypothetical protein Poli38472_002138 [Pythium oligandrum]|uniref:UBC core domain-containing protein n=1 Tax=Pythium oligandrum TaxID=41045 RepID=A0A8K1FKU8_PYTOL|nr:hypothetical protein Poli38472_002138 [Pythium oligandrum]|eukprot:TMW63197.1 hypothetical protein Poli38472_002138 [Pythium oligandrum]
MLRRLKNDDTNGGDASRNGSPRESEDASPRSTNGADPMTSLQRYRSQTMKDYGLMIEYKHLRQHVPGGIYVLPSFDHPRTWFGTIFIHTGLYRTGIFKFTINLPETYNGPGTYPQIVFNSPVFHPYVHAETRELDLKPKFPVWDSELHYMVAALAYLKSIFYMKDFPQQSNIANPIALEVFRRDTEKFVSLVEACVEESLETVYNNDQNSTIRFTKPSPAHENLRRELFAQLGNSETQQTLEDLDIDVTPRNSSLYSAPDDQASA